MFLLQFVCQNLSKLANFHTIKNQILELGTDFTKMRKLTQLLQLLSQLLPIFATVLQLLFFSSSSQILKNYVLISNNM